MDDTALSVREPLRRYATACERKLQVHDTTRGPQGWRNGSIMHLLGRLQQEVDELTAAVIVRSTPTTILDEAADVGNLAMMVADLCAAFGFTTGDRDTSRVQEYADLLVPEGGYAHRALLRQLTTNVAAKSTMQPMEHPKYYRCTICGWEDRFWAYCRMCAEEVPDNGVSP